MISMIFYFLYLDQEHVTLLLCFYYYIKLFSVVYFLNYKVIYFNSFILL